MNRLTEMECIVGLVSLTVTILVLLGPVLEKNRCKTRAEMMNTEYKFVYNGCRCYVKTKEGNFIDYENIRFTKTEGVR